MQLALLSPQGTRINAEFLPRPKPTRIKVMQSETYFVTTGRIQQLLL